MYEINKLRQRLTNVAKNVTEYRMNIIEAKVLLKEIDDLIKSASPSPEIKKPVEEQPAVLVRTVDGGGFNDNT